MSKSMAESEPLWPNLKYATLSDVRKELPATISGWTLASAFTVGIGFAAQCVAPASVTKWESPLPFWADCALVCSIVLWFIRGQELRFRRPQMSFGAWFGSCFYISALFFVVANVPWWLAMPALWGNALFFSLLDALDALGKENGEAFEAARA